MAHLPVVAQCPEPTDTTTLHFKALSKYKVINTEGVTFDSSTSLLAVSRDSGLTFVGTLNGFLIFKTKYVCSSDSNVDQFRKEVVLHNRTTHLATDWQGIHLAVACQTKMGPIMFIYNIPSFLTKGVLPIKTVPLSKPFQVNQLCDLLWQRNSENGLAVCFTDGSVSSLSLFQGSGNDIFSLPPTTQARCLCWSPKGKQIVIGCNDGSLNQYKPDLKFVKKLNPPPLFNGAVTVVNVLWISNFQFLAAYKDANKPDDFPVIVIVNATKNEPIRFINYDDITYSSVHFRPDQFYFDHFLAWNLIFFASANSMEVAVLHSPDDNTTWEQWLLGDASRAELPLNSQKSETFPLGLSVDFTSRDSIPWGEESIPPMPRLLLLSSEGLLITFNIINLNCPPGTELPCSGTGNIFEDSWFAVKEKPSESMGMVKMNQSVEGSQPQDISLEMSKSSQGFPSTPFAPLASMSLTPPENVTPSTGTFTLKMQPPKQQVVPTAQQEMQNQIMQPQVQIHSGSPSIFQNPNSASKWPQKSPFSFSTTPNSGMTAESGSLPVSKPNEVSKSVEQSVGFFGGKLAPPQNSEAKDNSSSSSGKQQKPADSSTPDQINAFSSSFDAKTNRKRTPETSPSSGTPEISAVDEAVYVTALWDEIDHFNAELKEVISRVSALRVRIGTEEEKASLRSSIEKLNDFQIGLNETTAIQKSEIQSIKSDVMEAFAWLEDARSRNRQRKSPTFIELKKSQDLDPLSSRLMTEINHLKYYIENQLKQLYSYLMKEWMQHQDSCRIDIKTMMAIPSMEELYKTMHLELKILSKQRAIVEELSRRTKERKTRNRGDASTVVTSGRDYSGDIDNNRISELFKLADNLLQIKIDREERKNEVCVTDAFQMMIKNQMKSIAERSRKFTREKQTVLRDILSEGEMLKTRSVKSTVASSSFIRNASSKIYSKALLTAKRREAEKGSQAEVSVVSESPTDRTFSSSVADTFGNESNVASAEVVDSSPHPVDRPKSGEVFTFSVPKATVIPPSNEKEVAVVSEHKSSPFAFKATSISPAMVTNIVSLPKSVPTTTAVCSVPENVVTCSPGMNANVFAFKFAEVSSTSSTAPTFSFTAKSSSTFSPRAEGSFSGTVFGVPQTAASDGPPPTAFSFTASGGILSPTTASIPVFGNAANLFPFSTSLGKGNGGNSIFLPPSSDTSSTAAVATPTTHSKSVSSNVTTSVKSEVGSTSVITSTGSFGRTGSKATTPVVFPVSASTTTTVAAISAVATTTVAVTSTKPAVTIVPAPPVTGVEVESSENVESEVPADSEQEAVESGKSEEVVAVESVVPSPTAVTSKTEAESSVASVFPCVTTVFATAAPPSGIFSVPSSTVSIGLPASNSGSIFGQSVSAPVTTANIFSTTTANIFSPTKAVTTGSSIFGASTPAASTGSIFGQPAPTTAATGSIFGQGAATTTAASTFGQPAKDEVGQTAKLFGDVLGSGLSSRNIFETPTSTAGAGAAAAAPSGNIFGKASFEKSGGSIFGNASVATATTTSSTASAGIFGSPTSNIFSKSLVPQTQMPTSTSSNIFGQPQSADGGNSFFGQSICTTFGGSINSSPNQNPFASSTGFGNSKPVFGQSLFGQNASGQNPFERTQTSSIFGGSPATTQNVFQSGSGSFGSLPPGPFSGGSSTTGQTGIGGSSAFQKPMGGNIFGSSPSFTRSGTTPTFGGAPTFGSPATFGSPQKVFGSPQSTFGQNQANAPTFGALANQTDGFANLALQSQNQTPAFGGNTFTQNSNFGGESNFGGTSFSSWRS